MKMGPKDGSSLSVPEGDIPRPVKTFEDARTLFVRDSDSPTPPPKRPGPFEEASSSEEEKKSPTPAPTRPPKSVGARRQSRLTGPKAFLASLNAKPVVRPRKPSSAEIEQEEQIKQANELLASVARQRAAARALQPPETAATAAQLGKAPGLLPHQRRRRLSDASRQRKTRKLLTRAPERRTEDPSSPHGPRSNKRRTQDGDEERGSVTVRLSACLTTSDQRLT